MLTILISWIIIGSVFLAFGDMLVFLWNKVTKKKERYSTFDTFWLGLCMVGGFTILISLFLPLSIYISVALVIVSTIYWVANNGKAIRLAKKGWNYLLSLSIGMKIVLFFLLSMIMIRSVQSMICPDFILYHEQTMKWAEQFSVVPGLGNIHGRLAFNTSVHLIITLFNYHPDFFEPFYTINSLAVAVFTIWLAGRIDKLKSWLAIIAMFLLYYYLFLINGTFFSSTSSDVLQGLIIMYVLFSCLFDIKSFCSRRLILCLLPVFCITCKLSSAPIVLISLAVLIFFIKEKKYKNVIFLICVGSLIVIPWVVRFVIVSGYLVYPFPDIDIFSFDWKMPIESVIEEKSWAYTWARIPNAPTEEVLAMPLLEWVSVWLDHSALFVIVAYAMALLSPIFFLILCFRKIKENILYLLLLATVYIGSLYACLAPDIRFGFGFIFTAAVMPFVRSDFKIFTIKKKFVRIAVYTVFLLIFFNNIMIIGQRQVKFLQDPATPLWTLIYKPQSFEYQKSMNKNTYSKKETNNMYMYVPDIGLVYDMPLPTALHFNDKLEMRGKTFQDGFRVKK